MSSGLAHSDPADPAHAAARIRVLAREAGFQRCDMTSLEVPVGGIISRISFL